MNARELLSIRINGIRLWNRLIEMGRIGGTDKGGCNRQALTDPDREGRQLFEQWCVQAGCTLRTDSMGNLFARRPGRNNDLPPVITGSHLDTQPTGGKFDGVYGVLAGVEVLTTLEEQGVVTEAPLEVVVWTNEEGARFSPAMIGSGVWAGVFDLEYGHSRTDKQGRSIRDELERIGYLGDEPARATPVRAAFELHIEQGPILENEQKQIGIVSGVQGMRWYDLTLEGEPRHAGPTPMEVRRDPFMALNRVLAALYQLAEDKGPWARVTFGDIHAEPGARNTVPERLTLAIDLRHPDQRELDEMDHLLRRVVDETTRVTGVRSTLRDEWNSRAVTFAPECVDAVREATAALGLSHKEMFSGAGHDAVYLARVAPTSMIFIPCENGVSHNEAENAAPADIEAGANVLLQAMLRSAETS